MPSGGPAMRARGCSGRKDGQRSLETRFPRRTRTARGRSGNPAGFRKRAGRVTNVLTVELAASRCRRSTRAGWVREGVGMPPTCVATPFSRRPPCLRSAGEESPLDLWRPGNLVSTPPLLSPCRTADRQRLSIYKDEDRLPRRYSPYTAGQRVPWMLEWSRSRIQARLVRLARRDPVLPAVAGWGSLLSPALVAHGFARAGSARLCALG